MYVMSFYSLHLQVYIYKTIMSRAMRKPTFCKSKIKGVDLLRVDSTILILPKSEISSPGSVSLVCVGPGRKTPKAGFYNPHHKKTYLYLSLDMRNPDFCICENKDADQLRGNREADQRLCFRYTDSTIPLLPIKI